MTGSVAHATGRLMLCLATACLCTAAVCQGMGPEVFGMVPTFGMSSPTTARQFAMGAPLSCVDDGQFSNPAFAPLHTAPATGVRTITTGFDHGPRLTSVQLRSVHPLRHEQGTIQVSLLSLSSSGEKATLPGLGPVTARMAERTFLVDWGQRLAPRLTAGLSVLGRERDDLRFTSQAGPVLFDLNARADYGFRGGLAYEWAPGDFVGLSGSLSQQTVFSRGLIASRPGESAFHSSQVALGVSRHVGDRLLAAAEYEHGRTDGGGHNGSRTIWRWGAEYLPGQDWAVRAGLGDGNPTSGIGYASGRWHVDYAFARDWNEHAAQPLFGSSESHAAQISYDW